MVTKDEAVQLFESQGISSRLNGRSQIFELPDTELQKLNSALDDLSEIDVESIRILTEKLQSVRDEINENRTRELQRHLEIWGYLSVDADELMFDLLLPIKETGKEVKLAKFVIDHCQRALKTYSETQITGYNGYVNIRAPLVSLQQVSEIVVGLTKNPEELKRANVSFAIYQRHPPLSQTYELTERPPHTTNKSMPSESERIEKMREYLSRHDRASRRELVDYLTEAGLGTRKSIGDLVDITSRRGIIKNVGEPYKPVYTLPKQNA